MKPHLPDPDLDRKEENQMAELDKALELENTSEKDRQSRISTKGPTNELKSNTVMENKPTKLPQQFTVKYLGRRDATGLWGIKHTRKPVDEMVTEAKNISKGKTLPLLEINITDKGVDLAEMPQNINKNFEAGLFPIEVISYGVQDLVYTRVFAMIVVKEQAKTDPRVHPFQCHAFVCDSRNSARSLTFALAEAFQQFSKTIKNKSQKSKPFAIDLRTPEEIEAEYIREADSEA